ncbi:hypothetical protein HRbin20_00797 [bacterium HR20]|nr:hypothetical protein HRbin20_00797 [bacterium HR20]
MERDRSSSPRRRQFSASVATRSPLRGRVPPVAARRSLGSALSPDVSSLPSGNSFGTSIAASPSGHYSQRQFAVCGRFPCRAGQRSHAALREGLRCSKATRLGISCRTRCSATRHTTLRWTSTAISGLRLQPGTVPAAALHVFVAIAGSRLRRKPIGAFRRRTTTALQRCPTATSG